MVRINLNKIAIYCDTSEEKNIIKYSKSSIIKGFTTNPSLMKIAGVKNYEHFAKNIAYKVKNKPISFEVFSDDFHEMCIQARKISSWGNNIFVKIPISNSQGKKTLSVIKKLSSEKIKLNITAVFDYKQIKGIKNNIDKNSNVIISIFSGRIADTGRDPEEIVSKAVKLFKGYNYVKILWASTREILNIFHAQRSNCHIITVPVVILKSLSKLNKNLLQYSQETVRQFYLDAKSSKFKV
jgi:transaldolase